MNDEYEHDCGNVEANWVPPDPIFDIPADAPLKIDKNALKIITMLAKMIDAEEKRKA